MAEITSITEEENLEEFNPLAEEVVINFNTAQSQQTTSSQSTKAEEPLPEAEFNIPNQNATNSTSSSSSGNETFNQDFANLPKEEQEEGAEQTADLVIFGYSQLKMLVPKAISISEKTLKKKEKAGEINLSIPLRRSPNDNRPTTVAELVKKFNDSIQQPFETSEEFKASVKPLLISIFKKKGVALSPEHLLMILVAQDIILTGVNTARCMADRKEMMNDIKEMSENYAKSNAPRPTSTTTANSNTGNRREPDEEEPTTSVNFDTVSNFENTKKEKQDTAEDIAKRVVATDDKKTAYKETKKRVRKPKVVVKATTQE